MWVDQSGMSQRPNPLPPCTIGVSAAVYIPDSTFYFGGVKWYGDGRGTSPNSPHYRLQVNFLINKQTGDVHALDVTTWKSRALFFHAHEHGKPIPSFWMLRLRLRNGSDYTFIHAEAHDGLLDVKGYHLAPAAWVNILVRKLANHKVFVKISYADYPATEAYLYYPSGKIVNVVNAPPLLGTSPLTLLLGGGGWRATTFEVK
jgi:hypothetical protein